MGNTTNLPFMPSSNVAASYLDTFRLQLAQNYNYSEQSLPYIHDKKTGRKYIAYQYTTNYAKQAQILQQSLEKIKRFTNPNVTEIKEYFRTQQNSYCTQKNIFLIIYNSPQSHSLQKQYEFRKSTHRKFSTKQIISIIETILSALWFYQRQLPISQVQNDLFSSRFLQLDIESIAIDKNPQNLRKLNRIYLLDPWLQDILQSKNHKSKYQAPEKLYVQKEDKMQCYNRFHGNLYITGLIGLELYFMRPIQQYQHVNPQSSYKFSIDRHLQAIMIEEDKENFKLREGLLILLQKNPKKRQQIYNIWKVQTRNIRFLAQPSIETINTIANPKLVKNRSWSQPVFAQLPKNNILQTSKPYYIINANNHIKHQTNFRAYSSNNSIRKPANFLQKSIIDQPKTSNYQQKFIRQPSFSNKNKSYAFFQNNSLKPYFPQNQNVSLIKFNTVPQKTTHPNAVTTNFRFQQKDFVGIPYNIPNLSFNKNYYQVQKSRTLNRAHSLSHYNPILQTNNQATTSSTLAKQNNNILFSNYQSVNNNSMSSEKSFESALNQLKKLQNDLNMLSSKIKIQLNSQDKKDTSFYVKNNELIENQTQNNKKQRQIINQNIKIQQQKQISQQKQLNGHQKITQNQKKSHSQLPGTKKQQQQIKFSTQLNNLVTIIQTQIDNKTISQKQILQTKQTNSFNSHKNAEQHQQNIQEPQSILHPSQSNQNQFSNLYNKRSERTSIKPIQQLLIQQRKIKTIQKTIAQQQQKQKNHKLEELWAQNKKARHMTQIKDESISNSNNINKTAATLSNQYFDHTEIAESLIVKNEQQEKKNEQMQDKHKIDYHKKQEVSLSSFKPEIIVQQSEKKQSVVDSIKNSIVDEQINFYQEGTKVNTSYLNNDGIPNGIIFQANQQNSSVSSRRKTFRKKQDSNESQQFEYVCQQYQSGSKYEGYKKNGMRNGKGKFSYLDGGYYEGQWKDNKMDGWGKLFYENGKIAYQGYWTNDQFNGFGKVYNDSPVYLETMFDYSNFDKLEDYWIYYQGSLVQDTKQGKGKIMLTNNQRFQGDFHADRIQGYGKYWKMDGTIIQGIWKDSQLIRLLSK